MSFDLHVPESRSLKAKRAAIRPIVDGLRHRFPHLGGRDRPRTSGSGPRSRSDRGESDGRVQTLLDGVERFVSAAPAVELLATETAWLEVDA